MFVYYYFDSSQFKRQLDQIIKATAQPAFGVTKFKQLSIPLPPLNEQRRIVEKIEELFTKLDAGVRSLKQTQALLQSYRRSVLKAAVEGELSREWREAHGDEIEPASDLLDRILHERREKFTGKKYKEPASSDTAEQSALPEEWEWTSLGDLADLVSGKSFKKSEYTKDGVRLFQIANVGFGRVLWDNLVYLPADYWDKLPQLRLQSGDVLLALNRPILDGQLKITRLRENDAPAILYQRVGKIDLYDSSVSTFLLLYMQSPTFVSMLRESLQGVDQPFINKPTLLQLPVPIPPLVEQYFIVEEVERRLSVVDKLEATVEANIKQADGLRQSILKQAFSGELIPQDPDDEPASVLLERLREERQATRQKASKGRRVKTGPTKRGHAEQGGLF